MLTHDAYLNVLKDVQNRRIREGIISNGLRQTTLREAMSSTVAKQENMKINSSTSSIELNHVRHDMYKVQICPML